MALCAGGFGGAALAQRVDPLPPQQAFGFAAAADGNVAVVSYSMPEGVYLYRDKLSFAAVSPGLQILPPLLPPGQTHEDLFFGKTTVFYGGVTVRITTQSAGGVVSLAAVSQGCDEQVGICYPPQEDMAVITLAAASNGGAPTAATGGGAPPVADEAGALAAAMQKGGLLWIVALFFVLGVGLSLTPCVLPMLPVLLAVIGGGGKTRGRIAALAAAYIAGVVAAYTALGVAAAAAGQMLSVFLQTPPVLIAVSGLFVLLALSLFGAFALQLPAGLQARLQGVGGGGGVAGAAAMGAVSAVAVSPCVAAPLVGALLYIAQTGDMLTGGVSLMALALGMSVLLAVAGVAGAAALPRAGEWMNGVKNLFGVMLLFVAVWVAAPLLPAVAQMLAYGLLLLFAALLARPFAPAAGAGRAALRALAWAALLWAAALFAGAAMGGRDVLTPLSPLTSAAGGGAAAANAPTWAAVESSEQLQQALAAAAGEGRPALLEFYADWCVSCKEMERFTFSDPQVQERLRQFALLRADVTNNLPPARALMRQYNVFGPPAILFFFADGRLNPSVRVIGYQNAEKFLQTLAAAQ